MIHSFFIAAAVVPGLIPQPSHVTWNDGRFSGRPMAMFVSVRPKDTDRLKACLKEFLPTSHRSSAIIKFQIDPQVVPAEAYRLEIKSQEIDINASTATGLYWALQTLRQLKQGDRFPCVTIEDSPVFAWRGVMLDEARHFLGMAFVKHFVDVMAMYKFNVLHWHLTDDQGWRIEIKSHPELTRVGAWRVEPDGSRSGGFYTQKQIKEIIAYAAKHYIMIVPEIEMPGHSSAAIASYPSLSCFGTHINVPNTWGVFGDVDCPGKETTFSFISDVTKEVSSLFPARYVHVGGDEVPKVNWHNCPNCQAHIKSEGLKDEEALQGYFTQRASDIVSDNACTPIGWDEVLRGGAPDNMIVQIWNDQNIANVAIATGHQVILSPQSNCYLNRQPGDLTLANVYAYDPLQGISDSSRVLGLEAPLWSENITNKNCMTMFLPRGLAISEITWRNPKKDLVEFQQRLDQQLAFFDRSGIDYGPSDRDLVKYSVTSDLDKSAIRLTATFGVPSWNLRYTLDGAKPTLTSPSASGTIEWPVGKTLRVATFKGDRPMQDPIEFPTIKSLAYGAKITFGTQPLKPYTLAGPEGLVDGLLGTHDFHDNIWLGWQGSDLVATCDLGKETAIHEIALHCLQEMRSWILMPTVVEYECSSNGQDWQQVGKVTNDIPDRAEGWIDRWFTVREKPSVKVRFIRIRARNYGKLPAWHNGAGGNAWVFADELSVK